MDDETVSAAPAQDGETIRRYFANQVIFSEGDPGSELFVILSGRVAIRRVTEVRVRQIAELGPRDFFGEMALVDRQPRSATAVALTDDTVLMSVDAGRFIYLLSQQPGFALLVMETLSLRKREWATTDRKKKAATTARETTYQALRVADDCFQLRSLTRSSNVYLFKGTERTILVDAGLPSAAPGLLKALNEIGVGPDEIDMIVLTHEHFDHTAAVPVFGGRPVVAALGLAANKIRLNDGFATMQSAFDDPATPFNVDLELAPGTVLDTGLRRLRVEHTPGHSSGSISLIDEGDGLVVCGDTVLHGGPIGGVFGSGNISDLIYSLRLLKRFQPKLLLPGHGPISKHAMKDIDATLSRCQSLLDDTRTLFDVLQGNEKVRMVINSYRDLNRSFSRG